MTDANTNNVDTLVTAYVYGELSDAAKTAFEAQMREDPAIAAEVDGLMAMRSLLDDDAAFGEDAGIDVPPPHLFDAILKDEAIARSPMVKAAIAKRATPDAGGLLSKLSTWFVGGGALVGAAAVVLFVVNQNGGVDSVQSMPMSDAKERRVASSAAAPAPIANATGDAPPLADREAGAESVGQRGVTASFSNKDPRAPKRESKRARPRVAAPMKVQLDAVTSEEPALATKARDKSEAPVRRLKPMAKTGVGSQTSSGFGLGGDRSGGGGLIDLDGAKRGAKDRAEKEPTKKNLGLRDHFAGGAVANGIAEDFDERFDEGADFDDEASAEVEETKAERKYAPKEAQGEIGSAQQPPSDDAAPKKPMARARGNVLRSTSTPKPEPVAQPAEERNTLKYDAPAKTAPASAAPDNRAPAPPPPSTAAAGPPKLKGSTAEYARKQRQKLKEKAKSTKSTKLKKRAENRTDFKKKAARDARLRNTERTIMTAATELSAGRYASSLSLFERAEAQGRGLSEIGLGPVLGQMQALTKLGRKADALNLATKGERAKRGSVAKDDVIAEGAKLATELQNRVRARALWRQLLTSKRFGREARRALRALEFDDKMNSADAMEAPAPAVRQRR